jgi:quercetin dioxygenase-like cupin family protein
MMKRVFRPGDFFTVPDGTEVSAFLNATDSTIADIPSDVPEGMSIAAGRIAPGARSKIHVHPAVTQVTYVLSGDLTVKMKGATDAQPYVLEAAAGSAVISEPGALLQLCNESEQSVEVLYIVAPSYVLEVDDDGQVVYDDSVLVAEDWSALDPDDWDAYAGEEARRDARAQRVEALDRLAASRVLGG